MLREVLDIITSTVQIQLQCELELDVFVRSLKFHYKSVHFAKCTSVFMGMKPDNYARFELSFLVREVV